MPQWTTATHTWTGWNGDSFDLTTGDSGVWLAPGARGMEHAPATHQWIDSPAVAGSVWNGSNTDKRDVFWPVAVQRNDGTQSWLDLNRRLWKTWHPRRRGVWSVTQPSTAGTAGETRTLQLRFVAVDFQPDIEPTLIGWAEYGLSFVAEQPFWRGPTLSQVWGQNVAAVNFFGGVTLGTSGFGPPFVIGSSSSMATSTVYNAGDVDAWPVWTVYGPCTSATVGIGDLVIEVPVTLLAGEWVQIDTDPSAQVAWKGSGPIDLTTALDVTYQLGDVAFASVADGQQVALSVSMVGTGRVGLDLTPLYYSAY